jgi:hypothetical protein
VRLLAQKARHGASDADIRTHYMRLVVAFLKCSDTHLVQVAVRSMSRRNDRKLLQEFIMLRAPIAYLVEDLRRDSERTAFVEYVSLNSPLFSDEDFLAELFAALYDAVLSPARQEITRKLRAQVCFMIGRKNLFRRDVWQVFSAAFLTQLAVLASSGSRDNDADDKNANDDDENVRATMAVALLRRLVCEDNGIVASERAAECYAPLSAAMREQQLLALSIAQVMMLSLITCGTQLHFFVE